MQWMSWMLMQALLAGVYATVTYESRSWDDYEEFIADHQPVMVTQHTAITRRRRSVVSKEETASFSQDTASYSQWYDFPEKMTFSIRTVTTDLVLNLTRNDHARLDLLMSDENGEINNDYASRFGVYYSVKQGASLLIECEANTCFLHGAIEIEGEQYHIEQDQSSDNFNLHTIRKKALPNLDEFINSLSAVKTDGEKDKTSSEPGPNIRKRRSVPMIPDCDNIEVKALADKSIWEYYKDRYGGNAAKAKDEIYKYFISIFVEKCTSDMVSGLVNVGLRSTFPIEDITILRGNYLTNDTLDSNTVDFRLMCLTDYFTHYDDGPCDVKCLRVILVCIEITKTSSWTDGNWKTSGGKTFVKGENGLDDCGVLNQNMANSVDGWIHMCCFTREDLALYKSGWDTTYRTVVNQEHMCSSDARKRTSVYEALGDGVDMQVAHGLLHMIGARDDKSLSCSPNGYFLMREPRSDWPENPGFFGQNWYLSDCTTGDICDYVNALSPNCMRQSGNLVNATIWKNWESLPLAGEVLSADEQCKVRWGNDSVQCDPTGNGNLYPENMCGQYIRCTSTLYTGCVCKVRIVSGTPCGHARICLKGQCVFLKDVPLGDKCECHSQCAGNYSACDADTLRCVCKKGYFDSNGVQTKGGKCIEKLPLDDDCDENEQCQDPNALCIDGTCQCRPCFSNNEGICEKQCLGGPCNVTADCTGANIICDPDRKICVCDTGFFVDDTGLCAKANGSLCGPCSGGESPCTQSGTVCSDRGFCECSNTTVEVKGQCYGTRVGDSCTTILDTCIDEYAKCNGTICECVPDFVWNGLLCVGRYLCDPCDPSNSTCASPLVCSSNTYRCECQPGFVQYGDMCYGTVVTDPCTNDLDTCADWFANCNGTVCDCMPGFIWNGLKCVGQYLCEPCDPSNSTCASPLVCSSSTDRCECPPEYVQIGDMCYGTRINDPCTPELPTCIDHYAECNGTVCDCEPGFIWNGLACVGFCLCDPCDPSTPSCDPSLVCSNDTLRCECPPDRVQIGDDCYGTHINDPCTTDLNTCIDDCAGCNGTVCDCLPGLSWNGSRCLGTGPCDPCDPSDSTCASPLVCSSNTYRCECPPGYVQYGDMCYGTRITEHCTTELDTCVDKYADCNGTVCDCMPDFIWNGSACVGKYLCQPCDPALSTCSPELVCSPDSYTCECPTDRVQIAGFCYGTRVTEPCTTALPTCVDCFAECNGTVCDCMEGFIWNGKKCLGSCLCDPCDPSTPSCDPSLVCSNDTLRCECPANFVQYGDECYGTLVTEICTTSLDTCSNNYAECNGTVCDCKPGFTWTGLDCVGSELCDPCDPSENTCFEDLVCSNVTNRCECPPNEVQYKDACYGTLVTELCTTELDTCVDKYADCNGTICDCIPGFIWNGSWCVGQDLCHPCDPLTPSCDPSLVCNPNTYRCECPPDLVQIGAYCYGTLVTNPCTSDLDTCIDDNAGCNGTVCDCLPDFIWNGLICVGFCLCDPCDPSTPSCDPSLVCSNDTLRCECPPDRVQFGDDCYGTRVNEECTTDLNTCTDDYAVCNGTICDCVPDFIWNGSRCLGSGPCDPCDPLTPSCDPSLVCSPDTYRCECPTDHVQIGDNCYGTRVTERCTSTLNTCTDDFAVCNGTVCDCIAGFVWNGYICVGKYLCDPCDNSTLSCDSSLVCNPDTNRCECPTDQVQFRDNCYGTRVTEPCTPELNTCVDKYAECNGTVCDCMEGFTYNGSRCLGSCPCDPCDPLTPSCDPSLVCSPDTYRCECPPDRVQILDDCYGTLISEPCTPFLDTCTDCFAECNGTVCDCMIGFIWNGSDCLGSLLCQPCDPSTPTCDDSLVCSPDTYRCECPTDQVQFGDNCYGTRVTEPCTTELNTCSDNCAFCNGTICDCLPGLFWNGLRCVGEDLCDPCDPYNSTCCPELVCSSSTSRCECPPNEVQIGDSCYGTLVTEPCTTDLDTCTDKYADCNGTVCDCIPGFSWNGYKCVGHDLCDPCDPAESTCDPELVCSNDTNRCECPPNRAQVGDICVGTRVTEPCTNTINTCTDDYAECNGTVCDCVEGFMWNGSFCVGYFLCDPCDPSTPSCDSSLVCSPDTYRCECPPHQVQVSDQCVGTRVGEECVNYPDTCSDEYAECNGTICDCKDGFVWDGLKCFGFGFDQCTSSDQCLGDLICDVNASKCICPADTVRIVNQCYGTRVGDDCTLSLPTCIDHYAVCNGTVCVCMPGFIWNGSVCVGHDLCHPCDPLTPSCDPSLVCSSDTYRCQCPPDEVQIGNDCYGTRVTESCTSFLDTCTDNYAECNGTVCDCMAGFTWNGLECVGFFLCDPCDPSASTCDPSLVCSNDTFRCECPPDQVQFKDDCYGTRVTENCTLELPTCIDDNAGCIDGICRCLPGFTWNESKCVGSELCEPCDTSNSTCASPLICSSTTYRCECPPGYVQYGDACYGTLVTQPCTSELPTCVDCNAECNGTVCDCKPGFTWNGSICSGQYPCDPCDPSLSTCLSSLVCSPNTYRCECPPNQVQMGDQCYGTRVTEVCTTVLPTCTDYYAECNGTVCDCIPGFSWNGYKCVGKTLCDPCDPYNSTCAAPLVCSSNTERCECPPNEVQIGDKCYGRLVTERCTTDLDTCIDDNAACNGTICDCLPGYIWNNTFCLGWQLCDPCDPLTPSCDDSLTCSPDTYRCECPANEVQFGDACYGTLVTEPCTTELPTCIDCYAECNGTVCVCIQGFIYNGSDCLGEGICDPCDPLTPTCDPSLECNPSTYRCECPPDEVQIENECYGLYVTEICTTSLDTCVDDYAECNGTICDCMHDFTWNGFKCVGTGLCDPCDPSMSTCSSPLVCGNSSNRCECPPHQLQIADNCYGTLVTEPCTSLLDTCTDKYADCNGTICDCLPGFFWNGSFCGGQDICDPCDPLSSTCSSPLVCSSDTYRCECPPDEVQIGDACYGRFVTEVCTSPDTCIDDNAECNGTICVCMPGFTWNGSRCHGSDIWHPCDTVDTTCVSPLVCSPTTYRCECPPDLVQIGDACSGTLVTEICLSHFDVCIDDRAACNGTVCDCLPGYFWNGSDCVGDDICDPCHPPTLPCAAPLVCGPTTYRCECPPTLVQVTDICVGTRVTEPCTFTLDTCTDDNAYCNGTVCDCDFGFIWSGLKCIGSRLCDPCDPSIPSCDPSLVCSNDTLRCECPPDRVQFGDNCYGTLVTEPCTPELPTCTDCYAECNGTVCDCKDDFVWNGSHCVGKYLCQPCDPAYSTCVSPLACSSETYRCECPPHYVQFGDMCYGTRVTEVCTDSLNTCVDLYAECNGTVCVCEPDFIWNGSKCVGKNLCDPCDTLTTSCGSPLVCSPNTYRCECPTDQVQYGDQCYGTLVGDPCTPVLNTCSDNCAGCNGTICDCYPGYTWNGLKCVGKDLCDQCDPFNSTCDPSLVCSPSSSRCECPSDHVQIGNSCYGTRVTQSCTTTLPTCVDYFAECNGTICDCIPNFIWNGSICLGRRPCDPCDPLLPSCGSPLVCNPNTYRCECPTGLVLIGDTCYGRLIGENCTTVDTCIDDNANCSGVNGVCQCISPFTYNATLNKCVGPNLDDMCDANSCGPGLICGSTSQRCECLTPRLQIDNVCYGTIVGETCTTAENTCIDDNANCDGGVCECNPGFTWNSIICVGTELDDPCDDSVVSCLANGLVCGPTGRCECPDGEVQFDNQCFSITCGFCDDNHDCLFDNQVCVDTDSGKICKCVTGYYLDNCNACQEQFANNHECDSDDQCLSGICICGICQSSSDDDCCDACDEFIADIVFVTDNSGSVGSSDYQLEKDFVVALSSAFVVSPSETQIGLVDYATAVNEPQNTFNMDVYTNNLDLITKITSISYTGGNTRTDLALLKAKEFLESSADRSNVNNYVVVLTDGNANDGGGGAVLDAAAAALKSVPDTTVYSVGVGSGIDFSELLVIASSIDNVYQSPDFGTLDMILQDILDDICDDD